MQLGTQVGSQYSYLIKVFHKVSSIPPKRNLQTSRFQPARPQPCCQASGTYLLHCVQMSLKVHTLILTMYLGTGRHVLMSQVLCKFNSGICRQLPTCTQKVGMQVFVPPHGSPSTLPQYLRYTVLGGTTVGSYVLTQVGRLGRYLVVTYLRYLRSIREVTGRYLGSSPSTPHLPVLLPLSTVTPVLTYTLTLTPSHHTLYLPTYPSLVAFYLLLPCLPCLPHVCLCLAPSACRFLIGNQSINQK